MRNVSCRRIPRTLSGLGITAALAALALAFCSAAALHGEDSGQVPYATIHKVMSRAQQVKHPKVRATVRMESKTPGVEAKDLVIQAKSGPIKVPVGDGGEVRNFPITPELLKENPMVSSGLPKGAAALNVALEFVVPDSTTYSYRELAQTLEEANAEMKKQAGMMSGMMPRAKALSFQFDGGGKQTVTINGKNPQVLTADANGAVRMEIDKSLVAQDPQVVVSEKPAKILVN